MQFRAGSSSMWFKYKSFGDSPFGEIQLIRRGKSVKDIEKHVLQPLYNTDLPIKGKKYKNLMEKLQYIPPVRHAFYKSLKKCLCKNENNCQCD